MIASAAWSALLLLTLLAIACAYIVINRASFTSSSYTHQFNQIKINRCNYCFKQRNTTSYQMWPSNLSPQNYDKFASSECEWSACYKGHMVASARCAGLFALANWFFRIGMELIDLKTICFLLSLRLFVFFFSLACGIRCGIRLSWIDGKVSRST